MADSVYDQMLDLAGPQIKTLADAVDAALTPESSIEIRSFDWDDIEAHHPGVTLRSVEDPAVMAELTQSTNERHIYGYPMILVISSNTGTHRDTRTKWQRSLMQAVRRYYHHRRRFASVSDTGTNEIGCTVKSGGPRVPANMKMTKHVELLTIIGWFLELHTA